MSRRRRARRAIRIRALVVGVRSRSHFGRGELTALHRHGLPGEAHAPASVEPHAHNAAARRRLVTSQRLLAEFVAPVRRERAVCRARDGIFGNAGLRREEARYEVVLGIPICPARDDDAAGGDAAECAEVRIEPSHGRLAVDFDEIVEAAAPRFISRATFCIHAGSAASGRMQTAAGLPAKGRLVNASTCVIRTVTTPIYALSSDAA